MLDLENIDIDKLWQKFYNTMKDKHFNFNQFISIIDMIDPNIKPVIVNGNFYSPLLDLFIEMGLITFNIYDGQYWIAVEHRRD